ncbi:hypothetical protein BGZ94_001755 [Podila epigama]|nr:hypothetical protein BGZ94_001755 [Podila epigama]
MTVDNPTTTDSSTKTNDASNTSPEKTLGPRKRSILLNMMLPPEAPAVDAHTPLPAVDLLFPPAVHEPELVVVAERSISEAASKTSSSATTSSTLTAKAALGKESIKAWVWGASSENKKSATQGPDTMSSKSNHSVAVVEARQTTTTVVSKTTQIRSWISRMGRSDGPHDDHCKKKKDGEQGVGSSDEVAVVKASGSALGPQTGSEATASSNAISQSGATGATGTTGATTAVVGCEHDHGHVHQQRLTTTTTTTSQVTTTTSTKTVALINVNLSVSDIFGIGKMAEIVLAMFHAHGGFLRRQPFWLQVVLLAWEATVVLLLVWGVLRVVGLAEVVVWGADDLVRGTISTLQVVVRSLQGYLSR